MQRLLAQGVNHKAPVFVGEAFNPNGESVGFGGGALDGGEDFGVFEFEAENVALAGVVAAAL